MDRQSFDYGMATHEYSIVYLNDKQGKISIHVFPNGAIQVDAPANASASEIKAAVLNKARWITNNVAEAQKRLKYVLPREYVSGESHFYLGRRYTLKVERTGDTKSTVKLLQGKLQVSCKDPNSEHVCRLLESWYRERARKTFQQRLDAVSASVFWLSNPPTLKLISMRKQWGSCSSSGTVILNPNLIKAPKECIDYVIAHELCHLKEHNHSSRFYRELDGVFPNWRSVKGRLDNMAEVLLA